MINVWKCRAWRLDWWLIGQNARWVCLWCKMIFSAWFLRHPLLHCFFRDDFSLWKRFLNVFMMVMIAWRELQPYIRSITRALSEAPTVTNPGESSVHKLTKTAPNFKGRQGRNCGVDKQRPIYATICAIFASHWTRYRVTDSLDPQLSHLRGMKSFPAPLAWRDSPSLITLR